MTKTIEKSHARFSPSSAHRWMNCPGSINLSKGIPEGPESPYAVEGTRAHACLEAIIKGHQAGKLFAAERECEKTFGKQMVIHALWMLRELTSRTPKGVAIEPERKADLSFINSEFWGTSDVTIAEDFGTLIVADYKYGQGIPVEAKDNPQLVAYGLAEASRMDFNFIRIELLILQPRAEHPDGPVRSWTLSMDDLRDWQFRFARSIQKCLSPTAPLKAGDWCRFCPARIKCPEVSTKALKDAQMEFAPDHSEVTTPPSPGSLSPGQLGRSLDAFAKIESWVDAVREHAFNELKRGRSIPGWKLAERRSIRRWVEPEKAFSAALKAFGKKALCAPELLSPAQLEKLKLPRAPDFIAAHSSAASSGLTLVRADDPRPASNQMQLDFEGTPRHEATKGKNQKH